MFLLAVSGLSAVQAQNALVGALLERLRPSLAILGDVRHPLGAAALVDSRQRLYLAHTDAVQGDTVQAKIGDWRVSLRVLGEDVRTGLVILALRSDGPTSVGPALSVADVEPATGTKVCVLLADGGFPATFVGGQQFAMNREKKFAFPVSELRFENPPQYVGGSLVVTFEGKLIGAVGSTVARPGNSSAISRKALDQVKKGLGGGISPLGGMGVARADFLPAPLVVGYTPTLSLFRRSVAGLGSEGHRPDYAALGILTADAPGGGAVIRSVVGDSPAGRGGVKVNDVLLAMGDRAIASQYDFVQALFSFRPGDRVVLRVRRDGLEMPIDIVFARSKN